MNTQLSNNHFKLHLSNTELLTFLKSAAHSCPHPAEGSLSFPGFKPDPLGSPWLLESSNPYPFLLSLPLKRVQDLPLLSPDLSHRHISPALLRGCTRSPGSAPSLLSPSSTRQPGRFCSNASLFTACATLQWPVSTQSQSRGSPHGLQGPHDLAPFPLPPPLRPDPPSLSLLRLRWPPGCSWDSPGPCLLRTSALAAPLSLSPGPMPSSPRPSIPHITAFF